MADPDLHTYATRLLTGTGLDPTTLPAACTAPTAPTHPVLAAVRDGWTAPDRCPAPTHQENQP